MRTIIIMTIIGLVVCSGLVALGRVKDLLAENEGNRSNEDNRGEVVALAVILGTGLFILFLEVLSINRRKPYYPAGSYLQD